MESVCVSVCSLFLMQATVFSGSAPNFARGILILYRWSRGGGVVSERRSSLRAHAQRVRIGRRNRSRALSGNLELAASYQRIERRRRKVWPSAVECYLTILLGNCLTIYLSGSCDGRGQCDDWHVCRVHSVLWLVECRCDPLWNAGGFTAVLCDVCRWDTTQGLSVCMSVCLSVSLSVCLSVLLSSPL